MQASFYLKNFCWSNIPDICGLKRACKCRREILDKGSDTRVVGAAVVFLSHGGSQASVDVSSWALAPESAA